MLHPDDLKKGLLILLVFIVAYSVVLIGLGYWLGTYQSEPIKPVPVQTEPRDSDD